MVTSARHRPGHVTVALSVFNGAQFVRRAVESIVRQAYPNIDLVVVDDCSLDGTFEEVLPIALSDPRTRLIRLHQNVGTYAAKNLVLRDFCHGEFFAHQDADDESLPARLEKQVAFLASNKSCAACGTAIDELFESPNDLPSIPSEGAVQFNSADGLFHRINRYPERLRKGDYFSAPLTELHKIKLAMNGSLMFRTATLHQLGGYDGRARAAGDTELLWRLLRHHELANLPEVLYARRFHAGSLTRSGDLGFTSQARRRYIEGVQEGLALLARAQPGVVATQDMHVPDVPFDVYD